jgi:hypothetical protein
VIYYLKTEDNIILATIYYKSDLSDVSDETIKEAIEQYERENHIEENSE